jgi:DNA-directed RNA polymerase specialized sigma24 family protein
MMNIQQASGSSADQKVDSELRLISRAQRREEEAFFALYELYKRRVYSLCLRIGGTAGEAEELTQEVFLRVFREISTFKEEAEFAAALNALAIKLAILRRQERRRAQREFYFPDKKTERGSEKPCGKRLCTTGLQAVAGSLTQ